MFIDCIIIRRLTHALWALILFSYYAGQAGASSIRTASPETYSGNQEKMSFSPAPTSPVTTYSGTLTGDSQVEEFNWNLSGNSEIVLSTDSYGGGTINGITTAAGGFVPVISVFDASSGALIASNGGAGMCQGAMQRDPVTHTCNDAFLKLNLASGDYVLAISEFFDVPKGPNIKDGFTGPPQNNFSQAMCGSTGSFWETDLAPCIQRDGRFTINIAAVPEPATLWLALPVIAFGIIRRKRN